jgi:predicted PhzF superfamily epimerase YddE/YHI9
MGRRQERVTQMNSMAFQQVDMFTVLPKGNPVTVILYGDALSAKQMQSIAT